MSLNTFSSISYLEWAVVCSWYLVKKVKNPPNQNRKVPFLRSKPSINTLLIIFGKLFAGVSNPDTQLVLTSGGKRKGTGLNIAPGK